MAVEVGSDEVDLWLFLRAWCICYKLGEDVGGMSRFGKFRDLANLESWSIYAFGC